MDLGDITSGLEGRILFFFLYFSLLKKKEGYNLFYDTFNFIFLGKKNKCLNKLNREARGVGGLDEGFSPFTITSPHQREN